MTIERRAQLPGSGERQAPFALRDNDTEPNDGWTLDGYGAVFNRMTVIDSWEGIYREQIANGSMKKSFRENPPIIQYDHGRHPMIGSMPIASVSSVAEESDPELAPDGGAHIVGRMNPNWLIEPLRDCLANGQVNGMSFRFTIVREKWQTADGKTIKDDEELLNELRRTWDGTLPEDELPIRTLQELRVPEMGPVCWPAYAETSVGVRSINLDELGTDPQQRAALARKLFAVPDLGAVHNQGVDAPQTTSDPIRVATVEVAALNAVAPHVVLFQEPAGEHPSPPADAPQTTDRRSAGEHPSQPKTQPRQRLSKTQVAKDMARTRNVLLSIQNRKAQP